jgi:transglutaminase-like putative cysteine protease
MLLRIEHLTRLVYSAPVAETVFEVRMAPLSDEDQTALRYHLRTTPSAPLASYRDGFGNRVDLFNIQAPYRELTIQATSYVRTHRRAVADRLGGIGWPGHEAVSVSALEYLQPSPLVDQGPALEAFVGSLPRPEETLAQSLPSIVAAVRERLTYEKTVTTARTPLSEALALGRGVCQDFAHLFLGACRGLGLPARYVSGYVNHPGELATHAWCQVWAGEKIGWVDVDPTAGSFPGDDHVVTAVGRDYADVSPNRGVWKGRADEAIVVAVTIEPVDRVPPDWNEWSVPAFRSLPAPSPGTLGKAGRKRARAAYPNQRRFNIGLHQQQEQQQQSVVSGQ